MRTFLLEVLMHPFFRSRYPIVLVRAVALASATPGLAQDAVIRKNHISVDVGMLQGGLSYARRISSKFSVGGGVWGAWEPWSSFESNVLEPVGVELFVRAHPSRDVHLEIGPSVLRYYSARRLLGVHQHVHRHPHGGHGREGCLLAGPDRSIRTNHGRLVG